MMKALGKLKKEEGIWLYETEVPAINDHDVLVRVSKTSLCGTDLHIYKWDDWAQKTIPVPMTVGHEFVGRIEKIGKYVKGFSIGDRVCGEGHITCQTCRQCRGGKQHLCPNTLGVGVNRPGCFAKYLAIPSTNLIAIPNFIPDDVASICDPLGNAVHTTLSFDLVGEDVLITGAGPIGIMAADIAYIAGARNIVITDINPYRLELAKKSRATRIINTKTAKLTDLYKELNMQEGFDVGLEMSGNGYAFNEMINHMSCGGKMALLGLIPDGMAISWNKVIFKSLTLKGIYGREMFETWYKLISLLERGLDPSYIITHHLPFEEFEKGFIAMKNANCGKVVLDWSNA